jgi:hypothetical protein
VVVYDVRQMVGRQAVGLQEHLIVHLFRVKRHAAAHLVLKVDGPLARHLQAHHVIVALVEFALHLLVVHRQRVLHVATGGGVIRRRAVTAIRLLAQGLQFLLRVEGIVGRARVHQFLGVLAIEITALGLPVRAVVAPHLRPLVVRKPRPRQRVDDVRFRVFHVALLIGVFNPQQKFPVVLAGNEIVVERRPEASNVEKPRRTGSKADADRAVSHGTKRRTLIREQSGGQNAQRGCRNRLVSAQPQCGRKPVRTGSSTLRKLSGTLRSADGPHQLGIMSVR